MPTFNPQDIQPLAAYLNRIGAHILNFRRFAIRFYTNRHYYVERVTITMARDGTITAPEEYRPTETEQSAIISAISTVALPHSIAANEAGLGLLRRQLGNDALLWPCYTRDAPDHSCIAMVQQRKQTPEGKRYLPWSFWSDNEWRMMEPDGKLPFWKPKEPTAFAKYIMVHEGAKSASFAHELVTNPVHAEALARHPWAETLAHFEHWGALGGALAIQRGNYDELRKIKPVDVVYFCDADWEGLCALQLFTEAWHDKLRAIRLGNEWPDGWDIADIVPTSMFTPAGRYIGLPLMKMCGPATWATNKRKVKDEDGKAKWVTSIRDCFAKEWYHILQPEVYVHKDRPNVIMDEKTFNHAAKPFSHAKDTANLLKNIEANMIDTLKYSPARKSGIFTDGRSGLRYFNTHVPSDIKPEEGSREPWEEFLGHLIPDRADRHVLMKWCATLIARPDIKMQYGMLLISETQGVGKSTLGEKILMPLLGEDNVSTPNESDIAGSNFNYWCSHKRLAIIHEIYQGHSSKAYNYTKSILTDDHIMVNLKHTPVYQIENWMHLFACSNSLRALQLTIDDRRWFVPKVTEKKKNSVYWHELNEWLSEKGGLGIIKQWAIDYVSQHGPVMKGEDSPWTTTKGRTTRENYSVGQELVATFLHAIIDGVRDGDWPANTPDEIKVRYGNGHLPLILDTALVGLIRDRIYGGRYADKLEKPGAVWRVAKNEGWFVSADRARVVSWGSNGGNARFITPDENLANSAAGTLARGGEVPLNVTQWADVLIPVLL